MLGEDFGVKKIHSINRRMFIIGVAKFVIFTGIIARLFSLQITNNKKYSTLSDKNRLREWRLPPIRGEFLDYFDNVVAGNLNGVNAASPTPDSWAANPENGVAVLTIKMEANAKWNLPATDKKVNRTLYFYRGDHLIIDANEISVNHLIEINPAVDLTLENGNEEGFLLMLQGKAIAPKTKAAYF